MTEPVRIPVESSLLSSVSYFNTTLELQFRNGAIYQYFAVPSDIFQGLVNAKSKGTYFNQHIRDRFQHQRLA